MKTLTLAPLTMALSLALCAEATAAPVPNAYRISAFVTRNGQPFTGTVDLSVQLFDSASGGVPIADTVVLEDQPVQAGSLLANVDYGLVNPFGNQETWLGGGIRLGTSTGAFAGFTSRARFTPTGFALHAQKIAPGIVGTAEIRANEVQRRIDSGCPDGQAIRSIGADGAVICQLAGGGTGGGDITAVTAGVGLSGGGATGDVSLAVAALGITNALLAPAAVDASKILDSEVQRRVSGACNPGEAIRTIGIDGSVSCQSSAGAGWAVTGNGGTIQGTNFLGTTDDVPLDLRSNNQRGLRLRQLEDPTGSAYGGAISTMAVIAGAPSNQATQPGGTVGGGGNADFGNIANGKYATVPGGLRNTAGGDYSFAAGYRALVRNSFAVGGGDTNGDAGTFIFADSQDNGFVSTGENQFLVRAAGGFWFGTTSTPDIGANRLIDTSTGAHLTSGGTWTNSSSRALKHAFAAVDIARVLDQVVALPVLRWEYKQSGEGVHLGPMAEDFHAAFGLGSDAQHISTVDADGIALAAIQALARENAQLREALDGLERRLAAMEAAR